jgi:hypothetical protein
MEREARDIEAQRGLLREMTGVHRMEMREFGEAARRMRDETVRKVTGQIAGVREDARRCREDCARMRRIADRTEAAIGVRIVGDAINVKIDSGVGKAESGGHAPTVNGHSDDDAELLGSAIEGHSDLVNVKGDVPQPEADSEPVNGHIEGDSELVNV